MTETELLMDIVETAGGDIEALPDNLTTTLLKEIIVAAGGNTDDLPDNLESTLLKRLKEAIESGGGSGGGAAVTEKEVNFYDYDGTCLYAYTVEEAQALSELPKLPEREGLICQGWNYDLETIKTYKQAVNVGAMYMTDNGATRIYIHLEEGRLSPRLYVKLQGTMSVNWGDGTEPDVLTKPSFAYEATTNHTYDKPGDYVIELHVDGEIRFTGGTSENKGGYLLSYDNASWTNASYRNTIQKIELGEGISYTGDYAFAYLYSLKSITIPNGVNDISACTFIGCHSLCAIVIPNSVTSMGNNAIRECYSLKHVSIPNSVISYSGYILSKCLALRSIIIPDSITTLGAYVFENDYAATRIIMSGAISSIDKYAFSTCSSVRYYDFTKCTEVPTLIATTAFYQIASDCEIRVPAALYDEWIAATNWATYANQIVAA